MKFIQNEELREWVKDTLKKTIFQKAHALAVQTGCDILVKLQDNTEDLGNQYYATQTLQKAYINNTLRKHPHEILVSGETGSPYVDQTIRTRQDLLGEVTEDGDGIPTQMPYHHHHSTDMDQSDGNIERAEQVQVKIEALCNMESMIDNGNASGVDQTGMESYTNNGRGMFHQSSNVGSISRAPPRLYPMSQSPKLYQCALCQKSFRSIQILQMHSQTFHQKTSSTFSPSRTLIRNKNRNSRKSKPSPEERRYACTMCERTFFHQDLLKDHMSRSHMGGAMSLKGFRSSTSITATSTTTLDTSSNQSPMGAVSTMASSSEGGTSSPDVKIEAVDFDSSQMSLESSPMKLPHTESFLDSLGHQPIPGGPPVFSQPSSSSASTSSGMFVQSPATTPFRFPASGAPIKSSSPMTPQAVEPKGPMPTIKIMKAILAIGGPVSTANTVKDNLRNRNYDRVTNENFIEAANKLKDLGFGQLVSCKNGSGRLVDVFVKRPPEEVMDIVEANSALCDPAVYVTTFAGQTPVRLMRSSQLMENLIASGLVKKQHLKMYTKPDPIEAAGHNVGATTAGFVDNYNIGQFDMHNVGAAFDAAASGQDEGLFDVHSLMDAHNIGPLDMVPADGQGVGRLNEQSTDNGQTGNNVETMDGHSLTNSGQVNRQNVDSNVNAAAGAMKEQNAEAPNSAGDSVIPMEDIVNLEPCDV